MDFEDFDPENFPEFDDTTPLDSLDGAFTLPQWVTEDDRLHRLYEVIVARMRRESEGVPMNTIQTLLMERIALNYIVMKAREQGNLGQVSVAAQKDHQTWWLAMTSQFNKQLNKATEQEYKDKILREVTNVIVSVLSKVEDPKLKLQLKNDLMAGFETAGI
jgi:hypothetical protein